METVDLIDFDGMYTGCDYDAETGLTYHWNRWRSEDGSAFISEDPARDGANWYGYAGCNPMVYTDQTGLAPYINGIYVGMAFDMKDNSITGVEIGSIGGGVYKENTQVFTIGEVVESIYNTVVIVLNGLLKSSGISKFYQFKMIELDGR